MDIKETDKAKSEKAALVMGLGVDTLLVNMRFLDVAINNLPYREKKGLQGIAWNEDALYYDAGYILRAYVDEEQSVARMYLHSLFHCLFAHNFQIDDLDEELWDLSCDIAVEIIIMELKVEALALRDDDKRNEALRGLRKYLKVFSADQIYRYYLVNPLSKVDKIKLTELFAMDRHIYWRKAENYEISEAAWKKISERIKTDIKTFSKDSVNSESLINNLYKATKEKKDYRQLLQRFAVMKEELTVSDDEFDYIYYSYGLREYGNMPLIEPLEYRDSKKIHDFAIVLDTSASCKGEKIEKFLRTTVEVLRESGSFFDRINVHIIQCDNDVQSDTLITSLSDVDEYIKKGKLYGYGGTDYRPAFEYIDRMIAERGFDDFRGLIYLTDGYGIYPSKAPDYDVMFVYSEEPDENIFVPWWVIRAEIDN